MNFDQDDVWNHCPKRMGICDKLYNILLFSLSYSNMYNMYACLWAHVRGTHVRTLSYKFNIVRGVARESYGMREMSIRSLLQIFSSVKTLCCQHVCIAKLTLLCIIHNYYELLVLLCEEDQPYNCSMLRTIKFHKPILILYLLQCAPRP